MPIYTYRCPICQAERTGLFRLSDPAPACTRHPTSTAPPIMVKTPSAPGFQVNGPGAYSTRSY
jgi:predicted nucleic acid-binding Zn ribbon protein